MLAHTLLTGEDFALGQRLFYDPLLLTGNEGGLSRAAAEDRVAQEQGFRNADHYWQVLADYVVSRSLT